MCGAYLDHNFDHRSHHDDTGSHHIYDVGSDDDEYHAGSYHHDATTDNDHSGSYDDAGADDYPASLNNDDHSSCV